MTSRKPTGVRLVHPLMMSSVRTSLRTVARKGGVDRQYLPSAAAAIVGGLAFKPLRELERLRFAARVANTTVHEAPVFIVGHARSGTTLLHELMCMDTQFGYVSTLHAMMPHVFLTVGENAVLKRALARLLPSTRPMDNMQMSLDLPQEEEYAIAAMTSSSYGGEYFLRSAQEDFDRFVLFRGTSAHDLAEWRNAYMHILKQATFRCGSKPLLLKNHYNTARIPTLLKLYPAARFVHIYRSPWTVLPSFIHTIEKLSEQIALQSIERADLIEHALRVYEKTMTAYWNTCHLIPKANLVEVRYENLEMSPLQELKRIYDELSLPGYAEAEDGFKQYLESRSDYAKNTYHVDESLERTIDSRLGWAIDRLNYPRSSPHTRSGQLDIRLHQGRGHTTVA